MTGKGTKTYLDGSKYIGDFFEGKMHGHGEYTDSEDGIYIGDWFENLKHGFGSYKESFYKLRNCQKVKAMKNRFLKF